MLADDHPLLTLSFDDDLAAHSRPLPLGDPGRDGIRQFVLEDGQQLLAHEFCDPLLFGDVADRVDVEVGGTFRHQRGEVREQFRHAIARLGRDWKVGGSFQMSGADQLLEHVLLRCGVDLVDDDDGLGDVDPGGDPLIAGAERHRRVDDEAHDIDVFSGLERSCVDPLAECSHGLVQTRCVDEDELRIRQVDDAAHALTGGLRLVADDAHLLAAHGVEQRALADVGSADERDESGTHSDQPTAGPESNGAARPGWT